MMLWWKDSPSAYPETLARRARPETCSVWGVELGGIELDSGAEQSCAVEESYSLLTIRQGANAAFSKSLGSQ